LLQHSRYSAAKAGREHIFVDNEPGSGFSSDAGASPGTRPIEEAPADVLEFGDFSPAGIRKICRKKVPGWSEVQADQINIDQLCEGLSNQNFKVHLKPAALESSAGLTKCVLFRIYGKDAGALYDLEGELEVVKLLSSYQIGPIVFANGDGWRIEEWHFSKPLPNRRMRNPAIWAQVAAQLGRLHKLSTREDFPQHILERPPSCLERLRTWGDGAAKAEKSFKHPESIRQMETLNLEEVLAERDWIAKFVVGDDPKIRGSGLDRVFSHWDSQENNILQTHYGLRFIDFEYAGMEYQAFDIATYFVECTIDYLVDSHPFFNVSLADFPTEYEMKQFCSVYLSEYLETDVRPDDLAVLVLLERVKRFTLMVQYIWSLWAVIRAPQAPTFNAFDYLHFGQTRWFMYKWAKRDVLHQLKIKG
jgi:thiamine kinase-like enzyme